MDLSTDSDTEELDGPEIEEMIGDMEATQKESMMENTELMEIPEADERMNLKRKLSDSQSAEEPTPKKIKLSSPEPPKQKV